MNHLFCFCFPKKVRRAGPPISLAKLPMRYHKRKVKNRSVAKHMRLADLLRCAKPLMFEDEFENFEYSWGGTFFLGTYHGRFYAFTAKHCLAQRDRNSIRLMFDENSLIEDKFLPLRRLHLAADPESGPQDYSDLAIIELNSDVPVTGTKAV